MVELLPSKQAVASSNLVSRSTLLPANCLLSGERTKRLLLCRDFVDKWTKIGQRDSTPLPNASTCSMVLLARQNTSQLNRLEIAGSSVLSWLST